MGMALSRCVKGRCPGPALGHWALWLGRVRTEAARPPAPRPRHTGLGVVLPLSWPPSESPTPGDTVTSRGGSLSKLGLRVGRHCRRRPPSSGAGAASRASAGGSQWSGAGALVTARAPSRRRRARLGAHFPSRLLRPKRPEGGSRLRLTWAIRLQPSREAGPSGLLARRGRDHDASARSLGGTGLFFTTAWAPGLRPGAFLHHTEHGPTPPGRERRRAWLCHKDAMRTGPCL